MKKFSFFSFFFVFWEVFFFLSRMIFIGGDKKHVKKISVCKAGGY